MNDFVTLVLAGAAGVGLGLFYFGGLWLTVRRLPTANWPVLLFMGSFAARTALTVVGFYFVMDGQWERVLACLVGFIVARQILISRLRVQRETVVPAGQEGVQT